MRDLIHPEVDRHRLKGPSVIAHWGSIGGATEGAFMIPFADRWRGTQGRRILRRWLGSCQRPPALPAYVAPARDGYTAAARRHGGLMGKPALLEPKARSKRKRKAPQSPAKAPPAAKSAPPAAKVAKQRPVVRPAGLLAPPSNVVRIDPPLSEEKAREVGFT